MSMRGIMGLLIVSLGAVFLAAYLPTGRADSPPAEKLKALIVDGQNNHDWKHTTPILKAALESSGLFAVDVATSPAGGQKMDDFKPDFASYAVVVSNYNGAMWPETTRKAFEEYV